MTKTVTSEVPETETRKRNILRYSNEESNRLTRECVETALIQLMKEQEFDKISITQIVKRAGVSRSAYYRNYSSKEDILSNVFEQAVETILDAIAQPVSEMNEEEIYTRLFHRILEDENLFQIILKAGQENQFLQAINHMTIDSTDIEHPEVRYHAIMWIGSTVNLIFRWLEGGKKETPEEMGAYCSHVFLHVEHFGAAIEEL